MCVCVCVCVCVCTFKILKDDALKVLHSICQQIWKPQQLSKDWKKSVFIPIQRMFKLPHNCAHFTYQQGRVQTPSCSASTVCEPRTSMCALERAENRRSRCQHLLNHRKGKGVTARHLLPLLWRVWGESNLAKRTLSPHALWIIVRWQLRSLTARPMGARRDPPGRELPRAVGRRGLQLRGSSTAVSRLRPAVSPERGAAAAARREAAVWLSCQPGEKHACSSCGPWHLLPAS